LPDHLIRTDAAATVHEENIRVPMQQADDRSNT
jgi:hypothetical protein